MRYLEVVFMVTHPVMVLETNIVQMIFYLHRNFKLNYHSTKLNYHITLLKLKKGMESLKRNRN